MKKNGRQDSGQQHRSSRWMWVLMSTCALVIVIGLRHVPRPHEPVRPTNPPTADGTTEFTGVDAVRHAHQIPREPVLPPPTAEEIVAGKVNQFARSRRDIARAIGRRAKRDVPPEVERFFDAVETGRWEEIEAQWNVLAKRSGQYEHSEHSPDLDLFWPAVLDAYGVAEQAHLWPAQKLLDYGNSILDSLRPGMVYVGGTDNGRWIPELLNETSGEEPHIIVTQNAFADGRYIDFMNTLYSDRFATLTSEDSQRAFKEYINDAQKRLQHDEQFPDEPKQVRPGESIQMVDGRVQVSGQVAVMSINEKLLQTLMQKNPELSFAMQESFPMSGTYASATPLGPIMELRAQGQDDQTAFTPERATESLEYWRNRAQEILSDADPDNSESAPKSYSHDAVSAANLLAAHNFNAEAEEAYRLASQLWPANPESAGDLADLLARSGREKEARQLLEDFARQHPDERKSLERISGVWRMISGAQAGKP